MKHIFDVDIAVQYGVNAAILFENILYWTKYNESNGLNYHDGCYWTFNSRKAYHILYPYMSEKQVYSALHTLLDAGLIISGNYNEKTYDRTTWYAISEKGKSIVPTGTMDCPQRDNGLSPEGQPIPLETHYKHIEKQYNAGKPQKRSVFIPPTVEEVASYCAERNNGIDAHMFVDYYESKGWMIGKSKMKSWKAAVRTWESRRRQEKKPQQSETEYWMGVIAKNEPESYI